MPGYKTGSAELQQAAKSMMDTNQQLQGNLSKLASEVEQIEGVWKGSAATAFQTLMEAFQTDAKKLNDNLDQIAQAIDSNAKNYQAQEEQASQSISSITSALGG